MKLMHEKNHEFARIMNCEIMKCEDPLYSSQQDLYTTTFTTIHTQHSFTLMLTQSRGSSLFYKASRSKTLGYMYVLS